MTYMKCEWIHDNDKYPVMLYSELDPRRMEHRKVEIFRDGRIGVADTEISTCGTQLGIEPLPPIDEIASDSQFVPVEITQQEFESVWTQGNKQQ